MQLLLNPKKGPNNKQRLKVIAHSEIFTCVFQGFFLYSSSFPIKMHATDAKMQKIDPDPNFFYDGRKFQRQCLNVIDIM